MAKIFRSSVIDAPGDKVSSIRNFNLKDGGNIKERLLALSDVKHLCTYTILESPLPLENYVATLRLAPVTDGNRTYAEWKAEFNCRLEEEDLVVTTGLISSHFQLITNLYERNKGSKKR
ncbi:MAG: SRPBCC family protein [Deltaproteobacteria bacterium]|nr:SRPBCC family protein [Deltaproteobacteria bacterium]